MANKNLFSTKTGKITGVPQTDTTNLAGGKAYQMSDRHALAQFAATGCLGGTFYATAESQLDKVLELASKVDGEFIAKTAVYARKYGHMKDMPALLVAVLAGRGDNVNLRKAFVKVIDNGRMLRNFVQIVRSGKVGRNSLGTLPKKLVQQFLDRRTDEQVFADSVGNDPSLVDVIKMVHPKPGNKSREALYGYLLGKEYVKRNLPKIVKDFEAYKAGKRETVPEVPFQMLTSMELTTEDWAKIAENGNWHFVRMNLNTFARHGVFNDPKMVKKIAEKLADPELIKRSRVFPYQIMTAFQNVDPLIPTVITNALQDAMEHAIANVPEFKGNVYVFPDVSGSMSSSVTGYRGTVSSKVRCIDVAALVAASVMRKNPNATVIPFESRVVDRLKLNPRDSIMTNAQKLASIGGGGTNCSAPMQKLVQEKAKADLIIYVSDNESWMDRGYIWGTGVEEEFKKLKKLNPNVKMVCIDIVPNTTTQAKDRADVLNIGGFSDTVFDVINAFVEGGTEGSHWTNIIDGISLD